MINLSEQKMNITIKPLVIMIFTAIATIIATGTALSGFFVGQSIAKFKTSDRAIVVKGFSEREVKSDMGELMLIFKNPGNDLVEMQKKSEQDKEAVLAFLKSKGLKDEEISFDGTELFDRQTREYSIQGEKNEYRYILTTRIKINTKQVDVIKDISNHTAELIKQQVNIATNMRYYFTHFDDLRTEMIAEATQSARQAALQFAKDSGSQVGEIRKAVQGAFSITSPNEEYNEVGSIHKKIRVVTTVTFNLVD
jgi:hypothetical protein